MCGFELQLHSLFQLPDNAHPMKQVMLEVLGFLPLTWKTQTEFPVPGFNLAQPQLLKKIFLRSEATEGNSLCCLYFPMCFSAFKMNKNLVKSSIKPMQLEKLQEVEQIQQGTSHFSKAAMR